MSKLWKTLKVFVSSTFRDLELARDKMAHVFREIEKNILSRQLILRPYDLRWQDRHSGQSVVQWCLEMVESCQYFIGILGHRYGWRPEIMADGEKNIHNISITEMEINKAMRETKKERRFFCLEAGEKIDPEETEEDKNSIQNLKNRLIQSGEKVFTYKNLDDLLEIIQKQFQAILDVEYPPGEKVEAEYYSFREALQDICKEKVLGFVGRKSYLEELNRFVESNSSPNYFVIHANAGAGKSALLAKFIDNCPEKCVAHYMKMSGNSGAIEGVIQSLGEQLFSLDILQSPLNADIQLAQIQIQNALAQCEEKLVFAIDGLDEMDEYGQKLIWLPKNLPENIRVLLTTRPSTALDQLRKFSRYEELALPPLMEEEIVEIIQNYAKTHHWDLDQEDVKLLQKRASGNPLFLKVALDEICASGIAVGQLATSVDALFDQIISRLEKKYGQELVQSYLGLIAAGRSGILEKELAENLMVADDQLANFSSSLRNFVVSRRDFLDFFHPEFERTIKIRAGKSGMRNYHQRLAKYFAEKGYTYIRTLEELPYQQQWGEKYEDLLHTLTNISFLEQKTSMGMSQNLYQDFRFALTQGAVPIPKNLEVEIAEGIKVNREILQLLARALENDPQFVQYNPESLFQTFWNICYWHDSPETALHCEREASAPWKKTGLKLYSLVEHWRKNQQSSKTWLKSIKPIPQRLDSPLIKTLRGHKQAVESVQFSPDGNLVASAAWDETARVWEVETGELLHTYRVGQKVFTVGFSPDSKKVFTGSTDGNLRLWSSRSGEFLQGLDRGESAVHSATFSPDGTKIIAGYRDGFVCIWGHRKK